MKDNVSNYQKGPTPRPNLLKICAFIILVVIYLKASIKQTTKYALEGAEQVIKNKLPKGYLVWSPSCKIPNLDPFSKEAADLFQKRKYEPCTEEQPLTEIVQDFANDTVIVKFHKHLLLKYLTVNETFLECCYYEISRSEGGENADKKFRLSNCTHFANNFKLPASMEFILIRCFSKNEDSKNEKRNFYTNAHALIRYKETEQKSQNDKRPINVLMFGIDSVSRLNLLRAMPETTQHLQDTGWFELHGYNKMGLNTFPNLMAILTGHSENLSYTICEPTKLGKLDACHFIWKEFKENGYATAYAEDDTNFHTFNYYKTGFVKPPVDHYFRPFGLAAENYLKIKYRKYFKFCLGYRHYVDHVYQYGIDFAKLYKNQSYFGLFWSTTFSHEDLSDPSMMDLKIKSYLYKLRHEGILNSSIVVFLSDHGLRYGAIRKHVTGWLEERLPFIFIWLPEWFQKEHPDIVQNLKINRNRLTTPYDLHMTLKHILKLSGSKSNLSKSLGCPNCQSLFKEIPWNRSCDDVGIDLHWCTCKSYEETDQNSKKVFNAVEFAIGKINSALESLIKSNKCIKLFLDEVISARQSFSNSYIDYLVVFQTLTSHAIFEATVRYFTKSSNYTLLGPLNRIDRYGSQSYCLKTNTYKAYCYCIKQK